MMADLKQVLTKIAFLIIPAYLVVLCSFFLPKFSLEGTLALTAYFVAESGGKYGLPIVIVVALLLLIGRKGIAGRRRAWESVIIITVAAVVLGGGSYANEHLLKPTLHIPRPNIKELAQLGALGRTAEDFYALGDKDKRSAYLTELFGDKKFNAVALHPRIRDHWASETGYSFPSGHATASFLFSTFFLALGLTLLSKSRRLVFFYALVPWAMAVAYSRPILRVHSPTDISVGAAQGIVLALIAYAIVRALIGRLEKE
jgi:phosphatidylglycerophosphatase B